MIYEIDDGQVSGYPTLLAPVGGFKLLRKHCPLCNRDHKDGSYWDTVNLFDGSKWPDFLTTSPLVVSQRVMTEWKKEKFLGFEASPFRPRPIRKGHVVSPGDPTEGMNVWKGASKLPILEEDYFHVHIRTIAIPDPERTWVRFPSRSYPPARPLSKIRRLCQRCGDPIDDIEDGAWTEKVNLAENGLDGADFAQWRGIVVSERVIESIILNGFTNIRWRIAGDENSQKETWQEGTAFMKAMRKRVKKKYGRKV